MTILGRISPSRIAAWSFVCLSLAVVFYVPKFIPGSFVASESYVFGYNNRVGFLLFVCLVAVGTVWRRRFVPSSALAKSDGQISRRQLLFAQALALALCVFMYLLTASWGQFRDATYLINRIELASHGLVPYRDFEFPYGLSFLYLPILLSRVFHLSIPNGYYLFWAITVISGIWMLYSIINRLDHLSKQKAQIFGVIFASMVPGILTTGPNYSGFRFLTALIFTICVHRTIRDRSLRMQIRGSLQAVFFMFLMLLISPELAVAFCLGVCAFFFLFYIRSAGRMWLVPYVSMCGSLLLLLVIANALGLFITLKSYASGSLNLPIFPAPHILFMFVSVFICACFVAQRLCEREFGSNTLFVTLVSFPPLAAAMGCCEPMKVTFNLLGLLIVCMLVVSNHAAAWNWYRFLFAVIFLVLDGFGGQLAYVGAINAAVASHLTRQTTDLTTDPVLMPIGLKTPALIPFGYLPSHNVTGMDGGYYFGTLNAYTPDAIALKVSELNRNPSEELLLPRNYESWCRIDPESSRLMITVLFAFPFRSKAVHTESVNRPLCDYISQNYYLRVPPQASTFGYGIWDRKSTLSLTTPVGR